MIVLQRHLFANGICWLVAIAVCNLATIILRLNATSEQTLRFDFFTFLGGFLLQIPVIAVLAATTGTVMWSAHRTPAAVRIAIHLLFLLPAVSLVTLFYFSSEFTHQQLGIYLSVDAFSVLFTDTKQVFLNAWHDAAVLIVVNLVAAFIVTLLWPPATARLRSIAKTHLTLTKRLAILSYAVVIATVSAYPFILDNGRTAQMRYNTFPMTYAVTTWLESNRRLRTSQLQAATPLAALEPIISLQGYADKAGEPGSRPPVFLIMLEAISSDHVGFNGYHRSGITPHLDALAEDSLVFPNAYAPSNHSNYAQTSISSSQYPRRRSRLDMFAKVDYPKTLLFDVLGHYGYETALFSSQNENWQGMRRFLLTNSKIDTFFHSPDALGENIGIETKLDDAFTREKAQEFMAARSSTKPLFLALNFQRTHFPYDIDPEAPRPYQPSEVRGQFTFFRYPRSEIPRVINRFDNALYYVDAQVGLFVRFLKERGIYDDAIIIVVPDHGEAFYQNGYPSHGTSLYDAQVKTFLLIKTPHNELRGRRTDTISLIDINPSVLALIDLPSHPNFQGIDVVFGKREDRSIFMTAQGVIPADGVVNYPWKMIRCSREGERLINVEIDPSEKVDFSSQFPKIRENLVTELDAYINSQMIYYAHLANRYYQPKY